MEAPSPDLITKYQINHSYASKGNIIRQNQGPLNY